MHIVSELHFKIQKILNNYGNSLDPRIRQRCRYLFNRCLAMLAFVSKFFILVRTTRPVHSQYTPQQYQGVLVESELHIVVIKDDNILLRKVNDQNRFTIQFEA